MLKCAKTHIITSSSTLKCNIPTVPEVAALAAADHLGPPPGSLNIMKTPLKKRLENSSGKSAFMWPHRRPKGCQEELKIDKNREKVTFIRGRV